MDLISVRAANSGPLPIDSERKRYLERIAQTPATARTSGVYFVGLHRALRRAGVAGANPEVYHNLKYYSLREFMELAVDAAATLHPTLRLSEGLKRLGMMVIPNFAQSFGGKMLMSLGSCSWEMALSCVTRGYQLSLRPGWARVAHTAKGCADIELGDVWIFGESYQLGVMLGLMHWYHINGSITAEALDINHTILHVKWVTH
jgi:uncharacterized protein (TIGR02265 family)